MINPDNHSRDVPISQQMLYRPFSRRKALGILAESLSIGFLLTHPGARDVVSTLLYPEYYCRVDNAPLIYTRQNITNRIFLSTGNSSLFHVDMAENYPIVDGLMRATNNIFRVETVQAENIAVESTPVEAQEDQLGAFFNRYYQSASAGIPITLIRSGEEDNINELFTNDYFLSTAINLLKKFQLDKMENLIEEADPKFAEIPLREFHSLEIKHKLNLHVNRAIDQVVNLNGVYLEKAQGFITMVSNKISPNHYKLYSIPPSWEIQRLLWIAEHLYDKKHKEGINLFLEEYSQPSFSLSNVSSYDVLKNSYAPDLQTMLFDHPTQDGYRAIIQAILYLMVIEEHGRRKSMRTIAKENNVKYAGSWDRGFKKIAMDNGSLIRRKISLG